MAQGKSKKKDGDNMNKREIISDKGVEKLTMAIIKQAVRDYMEEYEKYLKNPTQKLADYIRLSRRYFEENCSGLTYYGDAIVERAERIVRERFSAESLYNADIIYSGVLKNCA